MANEPKAPRKRASKKATSDKVESNNDSITVSESSEANTEKKSRKKAVPAAVASPIFQAPTTESAKPSKSSKTEKAPKQASASKGKQENIEDDSESRRGGRRRGDRGVRAVLRRCEARWGAAPR